MQFVLLTNARSQSFESAAVITFLNSFHSFDGILKTDFRSTISLVMRNDHRNAQLFSNSTNFVLFK